MKKNNQKVELFDIHTHILPNLDDGSSSIEDSLRMLREEVDSGVTSIIFTPHYRTKMFEKTNEEIEEVFNNFKARVRDENIDVNLYLGREIYINSLSGGFERTLNRINEKQVKGMNDSNYYLFEFSYTNEIEISEIAYSLINRGITPIIAHVERYDYARTIERVSEIKQTKALIQVNASSIIGLDGGFIKKFVWELLKNDLVDIVASDIHSNRVNALRKAYDKVSKKIGIEKANELFFINPSKIIK